MSNLSRFMGAEGALGGLFRSVIASGDASDPEAMFLARIRAHAAVQRGQNITVIYNCGLLAINLERGVFGP